MFSKRMERPKNKKYIIPNDPLSGSFGFSSGLDGNLTLNSNINFYSIMSNGRNFADSMITNITNLNPTTVTVVNSNGFYIGDEVIILNIMGTNTNYSNTGNYEFARINGINGNTISLNTRKYYGDGNTNNNIGLSANNNQIVVMQRIPNYNTLTINSGITVSCQAFDGNKYGIIIFRCNTLNHNGIINASNCGYPGVNSGHGYGIGGYNGFGSGKYSYGYFTGGYGQGSLFGSGAGGVSLGLSGYSSYSDSLVSQSHGGGGQQYIINDNHKIFLGSAGGGVFRQWGPWDRWGARIAASYGGAGGGIIYLSANTMNINGSIYVNGGAGNYATSGFNTCNSYGGGGGGGSIILLSQILNNTSSNISSLGNTTYRQASNGKIIIFSRVKNGNISSNPVPTYI